MKETLVYTTPYWLIQDQDLPPIGYHFVCQDENGNYEIRRMRDLVNGVQVAYCYDVDTAFKIAEKLNQD